MARAIGYETYVRFATKYGIPVRTASGQPRSYSALQGAIYKHEMKLLKEGKIKTGLYVTK